MEALGTIQQWESISDEMNELSGIMKDKRSNKKTLEEDLIRALLIDVGVAYVDASGTGEGPYYVIAAETTTPGWNREKFVAFFQELQKELHGGAQPDADTLADAALVFNSKFQRKTLSLKRKRNLNRVENVSVLKEIFEKQQDNSSSSS